MTLMLEFLETQISARIAPLVTDETIKGLTVEPFGGVADLDDLLERFRSRMPGAFMSPLVGEFTTAPVNTLSAELSFSILVGFSERLDPHTRCLRAYAMLERIAGALSLRALTVPAALIQLDYIRPKSFDIVQSDELIALLAQFTLGARNWRVNEPE